MLIKNRKIIGFFLSLALAVSVNFLFLPTQAGASPINAENLLDLVNIERLKQGLPPLKPNFGLTQAAYKKAKDIISYGYFAHTNPVGKPFYKWIEDEDYDYLYAGENLAIDFTDNEAALAAWLDSPLHRDNILNQNYSDTGIVALGGQWRSQETTVIVQMFGSPYLSIEKDAVIKPTILGEINIKKSDLGKIATNLIVLPSLAGEQYFDIIGKVGRKLSLNVASLNDNSITQTPLLELGEGETYHTLLKEKTDVNSDGVIFALSEKQGGNILTTPILYPSPAVSVKDPVPSNRLLLSQTRGVALNILVAGLTLVLILLAYRPQLRSFYKTKS